MSLFSSPSQCQWRELVEGFNVHLDPTSGLMSATGRLIRLFTAALLKHSFYIQQTDWILLKWQYWCWSNKHFTLNRFWSQGPAWIYSPETDPMPFVWFITTEEISKHVLLNVIKDEPVLTAAVKAKVHKYTLASLTISFPPIETDPPAATHKTACPLDAFFCHETLWHSGLAPRCFKLL